MHTSIILFSTPSIPSYCRLETTYLVNKSRNPVNNICLVNTVRDDV